MRRRALLAAVAVAAVLGAVPVARADGYGDAAYLEHELDNLTRSVGPGSRQLEAALDPEQVATVVVHGIAEWLSNLGTQVAGLPAGRIHATLGQLLPGANVGDPVSYAASPIVPVEVDFVSRTGALLHGRLWWDGGPGRLPGIVLTSGSIQAPVSSYHWAARTLAAAGYVVLTWDAQGQGESETFGHAPGNPLPTLDGVPFQQESNFVDGTVDALRFLLSTPAAPYGTGSWNPLWGAVDRGRVGLVGHSLGARAVSVVQQCSDAATVWRTVPACGGRSYPIRAVVAWDRLSADGVVPVVPAMDQQADGYFLFPQPAANPPDPEGNLAAFRRWQAAGLATWSFTVRGGTHCEWSWIPVICNATGYGMTAAGVYTTAWFDRYLHPDLARQRAAGRVLVDGPRPDPGAAAQYPWRADFFSVRYRSAISCLCNPDGPRTVVDDVRAHVGLSPVGDWAGANADRPMMRVH